MSKEKNKNHADPFKTRTGKTRLGPLNYVQLQQMLEKESRPKTQAKIRSRMARFAPASACSSEMSGAPDHEPS